jgi:hypothetical protein
MWTVSLDSTGLASTNIVQARLVSDTLLVVADLSGGGIAVVGERAVRGRRLARSGPGPDEVEGRFSIGVEKQLVYAMGEPPFSAPVVKEFDLFGRRASKQYRIVREQSTLSAVAPVGDRLLVKRGGSGFALRRTPIVGEWIEDSVVYGLTRAIDSTTGAIHWLPSVLSAAYVAYATPQSRLGVTLTSSDLFPKAIVGVSNAALVIVHSHSGMLTRFAASGVLESEHRLELSGAATTAARLRRVRAAFLAEAITKADSERVDAEVAGADRIDSLPLVSGFIPGDDGAFWLKLFVPERTHRQRFVMIERDHVVGLLELPAACDAQSISKTKIVCLELDLDGSSRLVIRSLRRQ